MSHTFDEQIDYDYNPVPPVVDDDTPITESYCFSYHITGVDGTSNVHMNFTEVDGTTHYDIAEKFNQFLVACGFILPDGQRYELSGY